MYGLKAIMRFFRQYKYVLIFLGMLVFCSAMVLREYRAGESAHVERREDFILLQSRGPEKETQRRYQLLIQELPELNDRILADDWQRISLLVSTQSSDAESLVRKYHISLNKELTKRAERRVHRALRSADAE